MGTRTTVGFERVQRSRVLRFKCAGPCKKPTRRSLRAECTINPFNKNEDGTMKNAEEVGRQADRRLADKAEACIKERTGTPCELCGGRVAFRG